MVILATMATIIASQAAITGSFSVAKQAVQLGFLPRLKIVHTSKLEGQIYVPLINWMLAAGVAALVLYFQHSAKLADIYGVAVTGTFILNTILFMAVARSMWHTAKLKLAAFGSVLLTVEVAFFSSNLTKIAHGAWLPLGVGLVFAFVMMTWRRGRDILTRNRTEQEGSLAEFLVRLRTFEPPLVRVPGTAIYLNPGKQTTPLALRAEVEHNHVLHDKVVIVSVETIGIPQVDDEDRLCVEWLGERLFKVAHVTYRVGYQDKARRPPRPRPGPQARPARAQPRPRARLLLRLADVHRPTPGPGDGPASASSCSSPWRATRAARSPISACPTTAP